MKTFISLKTSIATLLIATVLFSCKKQDLEENLPAAPQTTSVATTASEETIQWATYSEWKEQKQESFTVTYTTVEDAGLTASVADKGLVLVYKKEEGTGTTLQLPYLQQDAQHHNYWYYQVVEGQLLISCDVYGSGDATIQNSAFQYVVVSPESLATLFHQGYTREALMNLSYTEVKAAIANL